MRPNAAEARPRQARGRQGLRDRRMIISLDTETHLIDRAQLAPRPVCMSYASDTPGFATGVGLIADCRCFFRGCLRSEYTLIGVNIAFDMAVLGEFWPD